MPVRSPRRRRSGSILNLLILLLVVAIIVVSGVLALKLVRGDRNTPEPIPVAAEAEDTSAEAEEMETVVVEPEPEPEPEPPAPTISVCLDAGHGGKDPGCDYQKDDQTIYEKDETLEMVLAIRDAMEAQGIEVILTRDDDTFVELNDRPAVANKAGCDYFISIHRNTYDQGHANGVEVYHAPGASEETLAFAQMVQDGLVSVGVSRDRGVLEANHAVTRGASMPAILVEMGFVIDKEDNKLFYKNMKAYAEAFTDAVLDSYEEIHSEDAGEEADAS